MKKAAIIGAGIGGLALGIRLQSAGIATTIIEARDRPGGRAYVWEKEGFVFDAGPTVITDPACLTELWRLTGHEMAEDVALHPVSPFYRFNWPDGTQFDYSNDDLALRHEIAKLNPEDIAGYQRLMEYSASVFEDAYVKQAATAFLDFASMVRATPQLAKHQIWRSIYSMVSRFVKHDKLRQALSFHTLLIGGNPMTASAVYALVHKLQRDGGVWFANGGTNRLVAGMVAQFERIGGTLRLGDPVEEIETLGDRATGIRTRSAWQDKFDAVASNADIMHSYRDLLAGTIRGRRQTQVLERKRWSPSLFLVHFGIKGTWPGIPHHMILFGPRFKGLLKDVYDHGVLARDFSLYLHHPTVTDPSLAPEGHSTFYALAPVPHLGKLPIDWSQMGPIYKERILDEIERRLIPDIRSRIVTSFHYAPVDFAQDLNAHLGSAFSLEPVLTQSAWFRPHNRDEMIRNLYFVGAAIHPGPGIPGVVAGAKATAGLMIEDLRL